MICFDKITEIYSIVDEFCKNFEEQTSSFLLGNKPKRPPKMSTSEVITITLLFHLSGFRTFKHFYLFYVQKHMQSDFPVTVSYNRFVELQQGGLMAMTIFAKTCCLGQCTGISFIDSTPIRVCKNKTYYQKQGIQRFGRNRQVNYGLVSWVQITYCYQ